MIEAAGMFQNIHIKSYCCVMGLKLQPSLPLLCATAFPLILAILLGHHAVGPVGSVQLKSPQSLPSPSPD